MFVPGKAYTRECFEDEFQRHKVGKAKILVPRPLLPYAGPYIVLWSCYALSSTGHYRPMTLPGTVFGQDPGTSNL